MWDATQMRYDKKGENKNKLKNIYFTFGCPCILYRFLVNNQLDALILINYLFIYLLLSTCFELLELIIRRD
jgi:predicted permease